MNPRNSDPPPSDESFIDVNSVLDRPEKWARESLHDDGFSEAFIDAWIQIDDGWNFEDALSWTHKEKPRGGGSDKLPADFGREKARARRAFKESLEWSVSVSSIRHRKGLYPEH